MDMNGENNLERLSEAVAAFMAWRDGDRPETPEELLARHPDLAELLEPMFEDLDGGSGDVGADGDGSARTIAWTADGDGTDGLVGRRLGEFELDVEIGRGAMGVVHAARQVALGRRVAVKILPGGASTNPRLLARFKREAGLVARLDHEGIVKILGVGSTDELHYYAMDLVSGASLQDVLDRVSRRGWDRLDDTSLTSAVRELSSSSTYGSPGSTAAAGSASAGGAPPASGSSASRSASRSGARGVGGGGYLGAVAATIARVADALDHAHANGVIHRDVKPSNILVREDGRPVLSDFGLAREQGLPSMTVTGEFAGTPYYVSPEQALARPGRLDHRTDIFSLGVTLYELVTHRRPFEGASTHEVLQSILKDEPLDPQRVRRGVPRDLAAVVLKALEKDPGKRYQTAADFAADLRAWCSHRPVRARHVTRAQRLVRWARREPLRATLVGLLAVGALALTGVVGYLVALLPEIRLGEIELARRDVEQRLEHAFLRLDDDTGGAADEFRAILEVEPDNREALSGLVLGLVRDERHLEARDELTRARSRLGSGAVGPWLDRLGEAIEDPVGRRDPAVPVPGDALEAFIAGMRWLQAGRRSELPRELERASELLQLAVLLAPAPRALYHAQWARALSHLRRRDESRRASIALRTLWPDRPLTRYWAVAAGKRIDRGTYRRELARLVDEFPAEPMLWQRLAEEQRRAGDHEAADASYRTLFTLTEPRATQRIDHGLTLAQLGRYDEARSTLEAALAGRGGARVPPYRRGEALEVLGDLPAAVEAFAEATRAEPEDPATWSKLGLAWLALEDWDAARRAFAEGVEHCPTSTLVMDNLAYALEKTGDVAGSIAWYEKSLEIDPTSSETWIHFGEALIRQQEHERALTLFEQAVELDPESARAWDRIGSIHSFASRWEQARDAYARAIAVDDDLARAHYNHGVACRRLGDDEAAMRSYRRSLEIEPEQANVLANLGGLEFEAGHTESAAARFTRAAALLPDHVGVHQTLVHILGVLGDETAMRAEEARWAARADDR